MRKLAIVLVSLITAFTSITPAQAFPPVDRANAVKNPDVVDVRYRGRHGGHHNRYGGHHGHYSHHHGHHYGGAIIGGLAAGMIFGGMLGYPYYGSGYGSYYGSGYYPGAFYGPRAYYGPGAFYGPRAYYGSGAYYGRRAYYGGYRSCAARYRSYRAWDNTYQPYYGPRRRCW